MTLSIADFKAKQEDILKQIKDQVENDGNSGNSDGRFWRPGFDKERGGGAIIRFLPSPDGVEALPMVSYVSHWFKGDNGEVYSEKSLRTFGEPDPVADLNARLYKTDIESNKEIAKAQKQRRMYFANVLVIKDAENPENEGKVFIYKFGPAIYNLIKDTLVVVDDPLEEPQDPINVFNPLNAPNLKIKTTPHNLGKAIVPNYDKSYFDVSNCGPISEDEDEILEIIKQGHSLDEFVSRDKFKTYDELAQRLIQVRGSTVGTGVETVIGSIQNTSTPNFSQAAVNEKSEEIIKTPFDEDDSTEDDDESMEALRKMLAED